MDEERREFPISDILTVTTGILVSPAGLAGVYALLSFMTRSDVTTDVLPRAMESCRREILNQHPLLPRTTRRNHHGVDLLRWLHTQIELHGGMLEIRELPFEASLAV